MSVDDGIQTLLDQTAMEMAQARLATALQSAGLIAIEVTDPDKFMDVLQKVARRVVADADADPTDAWTTQAHTKLRQIFDAKDTTVTLDDVKRSLKEGLSYITKERHWTATDSWVSVRLDAMLRDGTVRETEPTSDKGIIEIIFPEDAFPQSED